MSRICGKADHRSSPLHDPELNDPRPLEPLPSELVSVPAGQLEHAIVPALLAYCPIGHADRDRGIRVNAHGWVSDRGRLCEHTVRGARRSA